MILHDPLSKRPNRWYSFEECTSSFCCKTVSQNLHHVCLLIQGACKVAKWKAHSCAAQIHEKQGANLVQGLGPHLVLLHHNFASSYTLICKPRCHRQRDWRRIDWNSRRIQGVHQTHLGHVQHLVQGSGSIVGSAPEHTSHLAWKHDGMRSKSPERLQGCSLDHHFHVSGMNWLIIEILSLFSNLINTPH